MSGGTRFSRISLLNIHVPQEAIAVYRQILRSCLPFSVVAVALWACSAPGSVTDSSDRGASLSSSSDAPDPTTNTSLTALREATARFQRFEEATAPGLYSTKVTPCWAHHSAGAMGYHYGKMDLFDANVELLAPEVLMYEPQPGGHMQLVGMEYIVPIDAWQNAGHDVNNPGDRPQLLGQTFTQHSFLPIYKLHIWLWRVNPQGTYADWNPKVGCDAAADKEIF
ncbi:MAG TPA: hypothetical protein VK864_19880 [Longimicrobiales bacterium]|nr:hypothetical protein [Longimicrobiales bacterium]